VEAVVTADVLRVNCDGEEKGSCSMIDETVGGGGRAPV
jgi:hypothetical protein